MSSSEIDEADYLVPCILLAFFKKEHNVGVVFFLVIRDFPSSL